MTAVGAITTSANRGRLKDARRQTTRVEVKASARTSISDPVGRAVQAAACKAEEAGAIPARDSILSGIGVERYTPVFQTRVRGAIPRCPSISQVNRVRRQRPRTVEVMAGHPIRCAWDPFLRDSKSRCRSELHRSGRGGSTPPSRSLGLQTLTVKSRLLTGENSVRIRGDPPFPHPW